MFWGFEGNAGERPLRTAISVIRGKLGDDAGNPTCIFTRTCSESMGEHLRGGPSSVMPNQHEQLLPSTALTARTIPWLTSTPCQPARPLSTMMPDHQPPGHGVLAQAAISRTTRN